VKDIVIQLNIKGLFTAETQRWRT